MEAICTKGFTKGFNQLRIMDKDAAVKELWKAIGCHNRITFTAYKNGTVEPKFGQAARIELVFKEYGITDIWDK